MTSSTVSAGIALVRRGGGGWELLVVHPGGPFWAKKDTNAWSIPKGELDGDEEPEAAAVREFTEELGLPVPDGPRHVLPPFKAGRKTIHPFVVEGDLDVDAIEPGTTEITWPPRSDRTMAIPEVDRAEWVVLDDAAAKLHKGQAPLVGLLRAHLERAD
ncbi:MAG: NUDIX domain-containing protein [Acidimicrobiales bacterium]